MIPGKVSIIVPSRNERFLLPTVQDLLTKAAGDIEVIAVLDGYWPDPPLPADPRLVQLHRGKAQGMRPGINAAAAIARGQYLLKCDAHTLWDEGYDEKLKRDYAEDNWVLTLRRYALDPEAWVVDPTNPKYPIDYHYISNPHNTPGDSTPGLHGTAWTQRKLDRKHLDVDEEMSSQGSGWFMSRRHWEWLGPLDSTRYGNFVHEFQEVGLKTWLGGGKVMVTKRTWYAHLYKGQRYGRGYSLGNSGHQVGTKFCTDYWMGNQWAARRYNFEWLLDRFWPVPTWPANYQALFGNGTREARVTVEETMGEIKTVEIVSARYGVNNSVPGQFVDVTAAVHKLVNKKGRPSFVVSNEVLGGPGSRPFPGKRKRLQVVYRVGGGDPKKVQVIERKTFRVS